MFILLSCIFFICICTCYILYRYKYAVLTFLLNINYFYKMQTRKSDSFYKKSELLFKNYNEKYFYLEEHCVVENGKEHNVIFISDKKNDIREDIEFFRKNMEILFEKRNLIVYCGIRECDNVEDDITSDFRSFMYYFNKDNFKLDIFFSYFNIDINSNFIIYKNDNNFTEKQFLVKDILDKTFKEILS